MQTRNPKGHPDFGPVVKAWLLLDSQEYHFLVGLQMLLIA